MIEVQLSNGMTARIDDEDAEKVLSHRWGALKSPCGHWYAVAKIRDDEGIHRTVFLHRFVMNADPSEEVDHWDRDTLNDQKGNLRPATRSQQNMNQRLLSRNTSGFKGVSWDKKNQRWESYIHLNGKKRRLGRFEAKDDAAKAYDEAARSLFGEFARVNFPCPGEVGTT